MKPILTALLYAGLVLGANPVQAEPLDEATRTALTEMRAGDMRKLVIAANPVQRGAVTYLTEDGTEVTLADSNGKLRIVNFWATWCAPCRQEKPSLDALQAQLGGADFEVIAIATGRNTEANLKRFKDEVGVKHLTTYLDPKSKAARDMAVLGLPVSVILDRDGNEIARLTGGADWTSESALGIMKRLIEGAGS